jgi:drug/metabolite transporter (DMT)-like permease
MQILALFVALIGLWFLTGGLKTPNYGDLLTFVTAIASAFYILAVDKLVKEDKSIVTLNFQQFFSVVLLSLLTMLVFRSPLSAGGPKTLVSIVYLAIFANVVTYGLQFLCMKHLKPFTASLLLSMEPVFAALFAWTIGNETFLLTRAVGGLFIIISIIISEIRILEVKDEHR